jgi:putative NADH-flavin reductase
VTRPAPEAPAIVAGATGHVGGALLERLLAEGRLVGCIVRNTSKLRAEESALEVVGDDVRAAERLHETVVRDGSADVLGMRPMKVDVALTAVLAGP